MLQPTIQEREFGRYAPLLESLDPSTVRMFYIDFCRVVHDYRIYVPACEEFRPEDTFSTIECGNMPTALSESSSKMGGNYAPSSQAR